MNLKDRLNKANLKATHQRLAILQAIDSCKTHPTPESIYALIKEEYPTITLATVYNTLDSFAEAGIINKVASVSGTKRYDPNIGAHGHIYIHNTDEILDYYDDELDHMIRDFFRKKKINNLKIKNITLNINGEKIDNNKQVIIK